MKDKKSSEVKEKSENTEVSVFEKEISRLPPELKVKLENHIPVIKEIVGVVKQEVKQKSMGFYVNVEMNVQKDGRLQPNFEKLTLSFLLDDYDAPISAFNARILLGNKFDEYLIEEIKKDEDGTEYPEYYLKANKNIKFEGTSIFHLRENCFDAIYDDLQKLGSCFVYEDSRGFISALKSIDIHRNMLLQKFEKYIVVYAGAGSWLRGEKSNDFDVFVVVDDTDVKRMPRAQVKDQLSRIIWQMSMEVAQLTGVQLHIQVYLLTDFWESLKDAHPVMFTFLRDGVPFYDRGIYSAWKELLKLGKIRPSAEAIDMHMNVGTQLIDRAKKMFAEILMQDLFYAVMNPSQAILMLKGYNPTTPKETLNMFKDVLHAKEKCINKKEVETLENAVKWFKKLEHNRDVEVTGKDVDKMIGDAEMFLQKIKKMFEEITETKTKESILSTYSELLSQIKSLSGFADVAEDNIFNKFDKEIINTGKVPLFLKSSIKNLLKAKSDYEKGTLTVTEVNKVLKEVRNVLAEIKEFKSKDIAHNFDRKRLLINYDKNKIAEIINYDKKIYVLDVSNNKVFQLGKSEIKEYKTGNIDFGDVAKYAQLKLDGHLIESVKKVLKTEEIFL